MEINLMKYQYDDVYVEYEQDFLRFNDYELEEAYARTLLRNR